MLIGYDLGYIVFFTVFLALWIVQLTTAEGLWSPDISNLKKAVLDRALTNLLLKHKLQPYLSRQVLPL